MNRNDMLLASIDREARVYIVAAVSLINDDVNVLVNPYLGGP